MRGAAVRYAVGVGEHLEGVVAGDSDERDAGSVRGAHCERGRRGDGGHCGRADGGSLLDHLDGDAAGQHDDAGGRINLISTQCSGKFVESVVAADVFANPSALGAFPAAWELAALFNGLVESGQEARVSEYVQWIEQLAWKCSGKAREALVLGALEHIFSSKKARKNSRAGDKTRTSPHSIEMH